MPDTHLRPPSSAGLVQEPIDLDERARFVPTRTLREAYLRYEGSRAPAQPNFVRFEARGLELGIVSSKDPAIARGGRRCSAARSRMPGTTRAGTCLPRW